jgi:regulator of replication initiation timing
MSQLGNQKVVQETRKEIQQLKEHLNSMLAEKSALQ